MLFYVRRNINESKNVACNTRKIKTNILKCWTAVEPLNETFSLSKTFISLSYNMFKAFYSRKDVRFQKCTQFYFKNNMAQGKMTDEEKQSFYKQNPILWENTDPNYRNKIKRSLIKVKLVALFELSLKRFLSSHLHSGGIKSTF